MIEWLRNIARRKRVRHLCIIIRLHRELRKTLDGLLVDMKTDAGMGRLLNQTVLDLFLPEYRRIDDMLRNERIRLIFIKLRKRRNV